MVIRHQFYILILLGGIACAMTYAYSAGAVSGSLSRILLNITPGGEFQTGRPGGPGEGIFLHLYPPHPGQLFRAGRPVLPKGRLEQRGNFATLRLSR
jgi:hypothetical protein